MEKSSDIAPGWHRRQDQKKKKKNEEKKKLWGRKDVVRRELNHFACSLPLCQSLHAITDAWFYFTLFFSESSTSSITSIGSNTFYWFLVFFNISLFRFQIQTKFRFYSFFNYSFCVLLNFIHFDFYSFFAKMHICVQSIEFIVNIGERKKKSA